MRFVLVIEGRGDQLRRFWELNRAHPTEIHARTITTNFCSDCWLPDPRLLERHRRWRRLRRRSRRAQRWLDEPSDSRIVGRRDERRIFGRFHERRLRERWLARNGRCVRDQRLRRLRNRWQLER